MKYKRVGINIKYTIGVFIIIINIFKLSLIKMFKGNSLHFHIIELLSPKSKISIKGNNAKINLGKKIRTRGEFLLSSNNGFISIGNNVFFNKGCMINSHNNISIGNYCSFGPNVIIYDHDHIHNKLTKGKKTTYDTAPVIIGENVWIGANTIILKNTVIGDNCIIAAGSVVKGIIPENSTFIQKKEIIIKKNI